MVVVLAACGGGDGDPADARSADPEVWTLAATPAVSIGVLEGDPEYELFRVSGAFRLASGETVVANAGTAELRYYDVNGRFVHSVGRFGQGPGEFSTLTSASAIRGDSVVAWDQRERRLTIFDARGQVAHVMTLQFPDEQVEMAGLSAPAHPGTVIARRDGALLVAPVRPGWLLSGLRDGPNGTAQQFADSMMIDGVYAFDYPLYRIDRDGRILDRLGPITGDESVVVGGQAQPYPMGLRFYAVGGDRYFFAGSGKPYVIAAAGDQGFADAVTAAAPARPAAQAFEEQITRMVEFRQPATRQQVAEFWKRVPRPDAMPSYGDLRADELDRIWVQTYRSRSEELAEHPQEWSVFSPDGTRIASLTVPFDLVVRDVAFGHVTGVRSDEYGVTRVEVYQVIDGPPNPDGSR